MIVLEFYDRAKAVCVNFFTSDAVCGEPAETAMTPFNRSSSISAKQYRTILSDYPTVEVFRTR